MSTQWRQKTKAKRSVHLPHISLRRCAGNGPRMSTTSPPYLSCNFRLFNSFHIKMIVLWSFEYQMVMMEWGYVNAEGDVIFTKGNYTLSPAFMLWSIRRGWWTKPDICVKLLVQRFHLVIQGYHLSLKVGRLISGEFCIFWSNHNWAELSSNKYKPSPPLVTQVRKTIQPRQFVLQGDISQIQRPRILVWQSCFVTFGVLIIRKYLIFCPTIRRHSPQTHSLQKVFWISLFCRSFFLERYRLELKIRWKAFGPELWVLWFCHDFFQAWLQLKTFASLFWGYFHLVSFGFDKSLPVLRTFDIFDLQNGGLWQSDTGWSIDDTHKYHQFISLS